MGTKKENWCEKKKYRKTVPLVTIRKVKGREKKECVIKRERKRESMCVDKDRTKMKRKERKCTKVRK